MKQKMNQRDDYGRRHGMWEHGIIGRGVFYIGNFSGGLRDGIFTFYDYSTKEKIREGLFELDKAKNVWSHYKNNILEKQILFII